MLREKLKIFFIACFISYFIPLRLPHPTIMTKTAAPVATKQPRLVPVKVLSTRRIANYYAPWGGSKVKRDRERARKLQQKKRMNGVVLTPISLQEVLEMETPKVIRDTSGLKDLSSPSDEN
jgi:hypothetical protein